MTFLYQNGTGESLGERMATAKPLWSSGTIWYVSSNGGIDGGGGHDRERPLATLGQAITNAVDGDMIVLMPGHTETIAALVPTKSLLIVGAGKVGADPSVVLDCGAAGGLQFTNAASAGSQVRNVRFKSSDPAFASDFVRVGQSAQSVLDCYFEVAPNNAWGSLISAATTGCRFERCKFVSHGTGYDLRPQYGLRTTSLQTDLSIVDCEFDSGAYGFSQRALALLTAAHVRLRLEGVTLRGGADCEITSTATGWLNVNALSGGSRFTW
jgi:hypothetical protein